MLFQSFGLPELSLIILAIVLYFLPTLVAVLRNHKNKLAVFLLNFLLGWTGLGWVVSLIWSVMK
ncbi:MAG: superinfection immunity protein [Candidatus Omnitrophota bacterium]|jgi:hypothetical protein|nr:MAG: superinfection immunity protein [Candidatus Omnitrophota bacterium]